MGTATHGGKGFTGRAAVSDERPISAAAADSNRTRRHANNPPKKTPPLQSAVSGGRDGMTGAQECGNLNRWSAQQHHIQGCL